MTGFQDFFTDLVLLNVDIPGVDKANNEKNCQYAIEQNEERVVAVNSSASFLMGFNRAQCTEFSKVVQP